MFASYFSSSVKLWKVFDGDAEQFSDGVERLALGGVLSVALPEIGEAPHRLGGSDPGHARPLRLEGVPQLHNLDHEHLQDALLRCVWRPGGLEILRFRSDCQRIYGISLDKCKNRDEGFLGLVQSLLHEVNDDDPHTKLNPFRTLTCLSSSCWKAPFCSTIRLCFVCSAMSSSSLHVSLS